MNFKIKVLFLCFFITHSFVAQNWEKKASYDGVGKDDALSFRIGQFAYLLTGNNGGFSESSFVFQYSIEQNTWKRLNDFPGVKRQYCASFVVNNKAYLIAGIDENYQALKEVWCYDPTLDSWKKLNDFPAEPRWSCFAFALNGNGYFGTGTNGDHYFKDVWKYLPDTDTWQRLGDFPGNPRRETAFLSIGEKAFVGLGFSFSPNKVSFADFYAYHLVNDSWSKIENYPGGECSYAEGFGGINSGIVVGGFDQNNQFLDKTFQLSKEGLWTQLPSFPLGGIRGMSGFSQENDIYIIGGLKADYTRSNDLHRIELSSISNPLFVYPNPSQGTSVVNGLANESIEVFDLQGKLIKSFVLNEQGYGFINSLPKGTYILKSLLREEKFLHIAE